MYWAKGSCSKGISCHFAHEGFATKTPKGELVHRCTICGKTDHMIKDCTAPGGDRDPKKEEHWNEYKECKAAANELAAINNGDQPSPSVFDIDFGLFIAKNRTTE